MENTKLNRLSYVGLAFLVALLFEGLAFGHSLGLGFVVFTSLFLVLFLGFAYYSKHVKNNWAYLLLIPIGILCFDILRLNNNLVHVLGPLVVLGLLILFCVFLTIGNSKMHSFALSRIPIFGDMFLLLRKAKHVVNDVLAPIPGFRNNGVLKKVFAGLLIAIPVLLVFLVLFVSADAVFADWIVKLFDFDVDGELLAKIIRVVVIGGFLSSFFYVLISDKHELLDKAVAAVEIDNVISVVVLGLVNVLFFAFVFFQIKYLFGDATFVLENGTTFADYARGGFFELAWVIALAGTLIGIVYWSMSDHKNSKIVNGLQIFLALQVGIVAVSALKRMNLYQDAYGYTVLRLYVEWFIYFVLAILAFGITSILTQLKFKHFLHSSLVMGLVALIAVFSVNVDYMIAQKNVSRFVEGRADLVDLDSWYLESLSIDVVPIFAEYDAEDFYGYNFEEVQDVLKNEYNDFEDNLIPLFEYNLGKDKALRLKQELEEVYGPFSD